MIIFEEFKENYIEELEITLKKLRGIKDPDEFCNFLLSEIEDFKKSIESDINEVY